MAKFYINEHRLLVNKACRGEVRNYVRVFGPYPTPVTKANWDRAVKAGLNVGWVFVRRYGWDVFSNIKFPRNRWGSLDYNMNATVDMWNHIKKVEGIDDDGNPTT